MRLAEGDVRAVLGELGLAAGADVSVRPLAAGAYHEHAILEVGGRDLVLRRCVRSQWGLPAREQLARERATLTQLAPTGVAPAPVALVGEAPGGPLLVEELVAGRPFASARDLPALGRAIALVHALRPGHLPEVNAREALLADGGQWLDRARRGGAPAASVALLRDLGRRAADGAAPGPASLVHTDLNAGNILVTASGACRLLDWEAARVADPAWDLAHAVSPTTTRVGPR